MSQEDAVRFLESMQTDEGLRPTIQRFTLSRNFAVIEEAAAERGCVFSKEELLEAVQNSANAPSRAQLLAALTPKASLAKNPYALPPLDENTPPQPFDPHAIEYVLHLSNRDYLNERRSTPILRYKGRGLGENLVLALIFAVAALYCLIRFYTTYQTYAELRDDGVTVEGTVTKGWSTRPKGSDSNPNHFYITYKYSVDGEDYQQDEEVSSNLFYSLSLGQTLNVVYSSQDPELAKLQVNNRQDSLMGFLAAGSGLMALLLGGWAFFKHRRESIYYGRGQRLEGVVNASEGHWEGYGRYRKFHSQIGLTFRSPHNRWVQGTVLSQYRGLVQRLPREGQKVAIYFVDDQHWWLL